MLLKGWMEEGKSVLRCAQCSLVCFLALYVGGKEEGRTEGDEEE